MGIILLELETLLVPILVGLSILGLGIYSVIHLIYRKDMPDKIRFFWFMGIFLIPILGPLMYIIIGRRLWTNGD